MRVTMKRVMMAIALGAASSAGLAAQAGAAQAADPSARLREVLPADVAERVLATIAEARARQLPPAAVAALENRALKFASRGVEPRRVEQSVREHAGRMQEARSAIEGGRGTSAAGDEIDAGAEAMRQGVNGEAVSALAKSAPSGRSLVVPLFVIGSLVERGLPSDQALAQVQERMQARASDADLERMMAGRGGPNERLTPPGLQPGERPGAPGRPGNGPVIGPRPSRPMLPPEPIRRP